MEDLGRFGYKRSKELKVAHIYRMLIRSTSSRVRYMVPMETGFQLVVWMVHPDRFLVEYDGEIAEQRDLSREQMETWFEKIGVDVNNVSAWTILKY